MRRFYEKLVSRCLQDCIHNKIVKVADNKLALIIRYFIIISHNPNPRY